MSADSQSIKVRRAAKTVLLFICVMAGTCRAESGLDLLSGFDAQRIDACYPIKETNTAGEMAKLLYRLRKADQSVLASRASDLQGNSIGDAVKVSGTIQLIRKYNVPEKLVEFLELEHFHEVVLTAEGGESISVFAPPMIGKIAKGDQIEAQAILIDQGQTADVYAAGRLAWFPQSAKSDGWKLLAQNGVDLSRVAAAGSRSRRTLENEDSDAFYSMLSAAGKIQIATGLDESTVPEPKSIVPLDILKSPSSFRGEWIRMRVSTVRVTRIKVSDVTRQKQLGQDHYFQIDASGDLGKTVVELARQNGVQGEPIRMSGLYPISLVSLSLPASLSAQMKQERSVVSMISQPVEIDGFFYRLWSYKNEFMTREGGGKQVGPLLIVARWTKTVEKDRNDGGVDFLGYGLAVAVVIAIIATIWWSRRNANEDAALRERRAAKVV